MILAEVFGFKKPSAKDLIKKIDRMMNHWKRYLHLAHSRQGWIDKNDHYKLAKQEFEHLTQQHIDGEDVTDKLMEFRKRIRDAVNNI